MITPYSQEIRFIDCDIFGHVNNAVYLTFFEEARIYYFNQLLGNKWNWQTNGFIIKKNEVEYIHPIIHNDKIQIEITLSYLGQTSFELLYTIKNKHTYNIVTKGKSVIVYYNHMMKEKKVLDKVLLNALLKLKK
jgi:acyl-CoA thioester hydrolase